MKKISYLFEFLVIYFLFLLFKLIPINFVSLIGGLIFQKLGPFLSAHKTAVSNVKKVFNNINDKEVNTIVSKSWNNLGKTLIELSILNKILDNKNKKIEIIGIENLVQIKKKKEQVIFFSIHQANWELLVPILARFGIIVGAIYRHINNPYINSLIIRIRKNSLKSNKSFYTPKGKESARKIMEAINQGQSMILLIDQKDSAGNAVQLFNYKVKTQVGFLKIAKKYNLKLIPIQIIREKINNFKIIIHSSLKPFENNKDDNNAMSEIHKLIEKWIVKNPDQWFWQHKRFD